MEQWKMQKQFIFGFRILMLCLNYWEHVHTIAPCFMTFDLPSLVLPSQELEDKEELEMLSFKECL